MDFVFKCPQCDQALEVDSSGVGSEIVCPSCDHVIVVPAPQVQPPRAGQLLGAQTKAENKPLALVAGSKAGVDTLIQKPNRPLETIAKQGDKKLKIKTFRNSECVAGGKATFDETVSEFLAQFSEHAVVSVSPFSCGYGDRAKDQVLGDFGVVVVYKS